MSRFTFSRALLWPAILLAGAAQAQQPPETHPGSEQRSIVLNYDRGSLPGDQVLWAERTVLGYSTDLDLKYGQIHLTCGSNSDSGKGRCPIEDSATTTSMRGSLPLRFTERRSGLRTEVELTGWLLRAALTRFCGGEYWHVEERPLWTSYGTKCNGDLPAGTGVSLVLPQRELEKLVAGRWDATLELFLRADPAGPVLATYTFSFDLTITDRDAMSIYFPEFDQVSPRVGLNIDYNPIGLPSIGGRANLDMCLYDGLGSQAEYFEVTVRDDRRSAPGRPAGMYSVWHNTGGSEDRHRLDYEVVMDHNGAKLPLHNDRVEILHGIDTAQLRLVLLPGMTQPVYCVPTPLSLITPRVPAAGKAEGYYQGDLHIEFTLPTAGP
ncbi:CfaE/CblD family pilus tip adhesin [Stenotrophomonas sp.]|uniref:CfaE/CblD family pilus tip adhesin n=1 Tax=Stenotrophomonas sp. TaxID=69392 RepID=UPI0029BB8833|nr:CfaE/CblD family pilus tip adhesin [Stenotrophomonas sp.]MDX3934011.1 CfaE/CblD family pilus tip adhesin [Stenotrophomonas sp.]